MTELGVGRYYVQEMVPLEDVNLNDLDLVFNALSGT